MPHASTFFFCIIEFDLFQYVSIYAQGSLRCAHTKHCGCFALTDDSLPQRSAAAAKVSFIPDHIHPNALDQAAMHVRFCMYVYVILSERMLIATVLANIYI